MYNLDEGVCPDESAPEPAFALCLYRSLRIHRLATISFALILDTSKQLCTLKKKSPVPCWVPAILT